MDSSYNDSTTASGDFWAKEDAEAARDEVAKEAARYSRSRRVQRAQTYIERQMAPKYKPSAMDNMITDVLEKIDDGFMQLSDLAFGKGNTDNETTKGKSQSNKTEKQEPPPLTKEEIEEYELEALRALVEGDKPNIPKARLNAIGAIHPQAGLVDEEEQSEDEQPISPRSAVDNDDLSDLRELEIEINHYLDSLKHQEENQRRKKFKNCVRLATREDGNNLLAVLKEVERRHEEEQLEQYQYRRQNMSRGGEHQIWTYLGNYYTGGASRPTNPSRVAPAPENIFGRMAPRPESEEVQEARINRMVEALNRRMAKRDAARNQQEEDDDKAFEKALRRRQAKKREEYDNMLFGLLVDMNLINVEEDEEELDEESAVIQKTASIAKSGKEKLASTLDQLDKEFYEEIEEAAKEDFGAKDESKEEGAGVVAEATKKKEEDEIFESGCLGCGAEPEVEETIITINGVPVTKADTTNVIDSQHVTYTPLKNDEVSDASTGDRFEPIEIKEDPRETSWFSFFGSAPAKKPLAAIPEEIRLIDPPEGKEEEEEEEVREKPAEEPKEQVHVKKGLKIIAILESGDENVQVGTKTKPIMIRDHEATGPNNEAPGLDACWADSRHVDLLTSE